MLLPDFVVEQLTNFPVAGSWQGVAFGAGEAANAGVESTSRPSEATAAAIRV
jgi:hypothetical protein